MKTLIWDYNGTIVDDTLICLEVENFMLKERNMPVQLSLEEYREIFCFPVRNYYVRLGYTFENETYEEISEEFTRLYDEQFPRCTLVAGFPEKLAEAKRKGWQNVIISAARQDKLRSQIEGFGLTGSFAAVLGTDNLLGGSKIAMAKQWMAASGTDPASCRLIGDSVHDMETALALGITDYTLVACGHQSYDLLCSHTERVVKTMPEVKL
ncbi:MAG: HAD family hydrolase [Solobacterium sp.]|nr:HAD family hydrolase [Solobacterium sp.]